MANDITVVDYDPTTGEPVAVLHGGTVLYVIPSSAEVEFAAWRRQRTKLVQAEEDGYSLSFETSDDAAVEILRTVFRHADKS